MKNRQGSYKKRIVESALLEEHFEYFKKSIYSILSSSDLLPYEKATWYLMLFLQVKYQKNWLQIKSSAYKDETKSGHKLFLSTMPKNFILSDFDRKKLDGLSCIDLYRYANFKGIPLSVNQTFIHWIEGIWHIELFQKVLSPSELLDLQQRGARCLTLLPFENSTEEIIVDGRDPLSFLVHDMVHAFQFFSHPQIIKGQIGFYRYMDEAYKSPMVREALEKDARFKKEFEYIAADMNGYVIHLFKCLKSAFNLYDKSNCRKNSTFQELLQFWEMPSVARAAAEKINNDEFSADDELLLINFFESRAN